MIIKAENTCNKIRQACRKLRQEQLLRKVVNNNRKRIENCITRNWGLVKCDTMQLFNIILLF